MSDLCFGGRCRRDEKGQCGGYDDGGAKRLHDVVY